MTEPTTRAAADTLLALSLSRPWPKAVERHYKRVENRVRWAAHASMITRARNLIGRDIALHSSGSWDPDGARLIAELTGHRYQPADVPAMAVTSVFELVGLLLPGDPCPEGQEVWYFGSLGLVLDNVRVLPTPVFVSGFQGFWALPADVQAKVEAQLRELAA